MKKLMLTNSLCAMVDDCDYDTLFGYMWSYIKAPRWAMPAKRDDPLVVENAKLRKALAGVIPWVGKLAEGPSWATPEAKASGRA